MKKEDLDGAKTILCEQFGELATESLKIQFLKNWSGQNFFTTYSYSWNGMS